MTEQDAPKKSKWVKWLGIGVAIYVVLGVVGIIIDPSVLDDGTADTPQANVTKAAEKSEKWPKGFDYTLTRKGDETDTVILFFDASKRSVWDEGDSVDRFASDLFDLVKGEQRKMQNDVVEARNFIVYYKGATRDQYGNASSSKFFGFVVDAETVTKLNVKNASQWDLLNLVEIEESKMVGKRELAAWCQNDNAQYTRRFCQTVRSHLN